MGEALRTQVHDLQPRVLMLERECGNCDNRQPAQSAFSKAASSLAQTWQPPSTRTLQSPEPTLPDSSTRRPLPGSRLGSCRDTSVSAASGIAREIQTSTLAPAKQIARQVSLVYNSNNAEEADVIDRDALASSAMQVTRQVSFVHNSKNAEEAEVIGKDAATSSPKQGTKLGRGNLTWAEKRPLPKSLPEEKPVEVVASMQLPVLQPVASESGTKRMPCHSRDGSLGSVPGLAVAAASSRPLQQLSPAVMRSRDLFIARCAASLRQQSSSGTSPCVMRRGSSLSPVQSLTVPAQRNQSNATSSASSPSSHLRVS